jgi:hypothetical protein
MKFRIPNFNWLHKKDELFTTLNSWFKLLNKKEEIVPVEKSRFKLKATFAESINFMVKYPANDKQSLIKEFTLKQWEHEIELINPANVFFKIFLTSNNFLSNSKVVLEIFQLKNNEIIEKKQAIFKIGKELNNNEWLKISWVLNDI